jgi:hypothetical protein
MLRGVRYLGVFTTALLLALRSPLPPLEIAGWIPFWKAEAGTADVEPHLTVFTSIMPFSYEVSEDGTLRDAFHLEAPMSTVATRLTTAARAAGVKIIPTVTWLADGVGTEAAAAHGKEIHDILSDDGRRIALEDRIAALVRTNGFDGIDIDFEGKESKTKKYFSYFLKGLDRRLEDPLLITCTTRRGAVHTPCREVHEVLRSPDRGRQQTSVTARHDRRQPAPVNPHSKILLHSRLY